MRRACLTLPKAALLLGAFSLAEAEAAPTGDFALWLEGVREDALGQGISPATLDRALATLEGPVERILELDRKQIETRVTLRDYLARIVTERRVSKGRRLASRHRALLEEVAREYGVQSRFVLAIWGIETSYGSNTGGYPVFEALATLAYDGRRSEFFRKELLTAFHISEQEQMDPDSMVGSWAGAMGQSQFMPTSFVRFAVDQDRDGSRDIWQSEADVFASIAHYLKEHGWREDMTWGRRVRLPEAGIEESRIGLEFQQPLADWQALGVRRADGSNLPERDLMASLVVPDEGSQDAYLVYDNFRTTMTYNRSTYYAIAVGTLADRLNGSR